MLSDIVEYISNNKTLIRTLIKQGYLPSERELFSLFANKANKLLSEIEVYKVYYKRYKDRIQKLEVGDLLNADYNGDLYWLFFGMGVLVFNNKSELEREDLYDIAVRYTLVSRHLGIDYIIAINEMSIPILKEHFNTQCQKFFYIKNYRKVPHKKEWPKITVHKLFEDNSGFLYQDAVDSLDKFRELAANKTVLFTGTEEPCYVVYKYGNGTRQFDIRALETLHYLGLADNNTIVVSCNKTAAEELGFGCIDGFYGYSVWLREKFLEKYGSVDFSNIIRFRNDGVFLSYISAREVYSVYKGFTEAALEKHKKTVFYKKVVSNLSDSLEASKIINDSAGRVLLNKDFAFYVKSLIPELKIGFSNREEDIDYCGRYPLLKYLHFTDSCLDIGQPGSDGNYSVNDNKVFKLYREILEYTFLVEKGRQD